MTAYTTWVVSTDGERARIFELQECLDALRELVVPEDDAMTPDEPDHHPPVSSGLGDGDGAGLKGMGIGVAGRDRLLTERLGSHLELQQRQGGYDRLVMIAPHNVLPKVIGSLSARVRGVMVAEMEADIIDDSITGIRSILPF